MKKGNSVGKLYVCSTPLGNLKDITLRTLEVLKEEVDVVAAEDTRITRKLLSHYNFHLPILPYHAYNKKKATKIILKILKEAKNVALMVDAGTPGISDPGGELIATLRKERIEIIPLPGPSAPTAALSVAGLPAEKFLLFSFLSTKKSKRKREWEELAKYPYTIIIFEAPHRILRTLKELRLYLGDRYITLCKELTKLHEKIISGRVDEILEILEKEEIKGEFTIVIGSANFSKSLSIKP
jgi:16S rRNA (cytidine1402-2'-O)-methyltransferase